MDFIDYYKILGVDPDADSKVIKTAYRKLARKYHPDMNPDEGAEAKFKDVAEAYQVLKDPQRRAVFDELRQYGGQSKQGFVPPGSQAGRDAEYQADSQYASDFSDFFNSIFGGRSSAYEQAGHAQHHHVRGQDAEIELPVLLEETIKENQRTIEYLLPVYENGQISQIKKHLNVKIPKGVMDGERIRLKGQGHPGLNGGHAGDLYLHIRVVPHPLFDVQGHNLIIALPLAPWEAALGTKVTLPTLEGKISLSIPPNTQSGKKLRIKGKGLKGRESKDNAITGDLFAIVKVVMPTSIDEKEIHLWRELEATANFDPRAEWSMQS